ncbi:calpain-5-like [Gambusia affinis]|uniref:calpain-5-like n=1 Tax=Gambusia affinis TaxID=33528 RepID=UPI001CDC499D|nr:calpain-5-like [Gambusia affinis]XP_043997035.1 calpain-5-like [Gambusia affinis]XP_043997036.1 calpain-5-like [Gambusia affinis]XP_043997037.1 calpain-5-like [Gambusia affinis]
MPVAYRNQHYAELKRQHNKEKLFEDPEFPATSSSIYYNKPPPGAVQWKRPGEICENPHLCVEGISSHDLNQGIVGNCWFVAACACLALKSDLWEKVIPDWKEQEWDSNYAGIFHFRFWIFGEWIDVVIDDRLPTINGQLIYCQSKQNNEFWSALLEKAYAKLFGCYESLAGGNTGDAVVDFSGAVAESIDLQKEKYYADQNKQDKFFEDLLKVWNRGGIISASISTQGFGLESRTENGLVRGHAYSVTDVKRVRLGHGLWAYFKNETIALIRLRNPWGKTEWTGAWSDSSEEWSKVGDTERGNLGITVADDGEFWMSFTDWCKNFTDADVCRLINTSLISIQKNWNEEVNFGKWTRNSDPLLNRCGGCVNHRQTFLQNPQYLFDVTKESDEVLISLQQKDRKIYRKEGQGDYLSMGFNILKVEVNRKYRLHDLVTLQLLHTSTYIDARTVFMRCELPQGRYVVIPTTFKPFIEGEFMLRLYTDVDSGCRELVKDKPQTTCWTPLFGYPQVVTHIYVDRAEIGQQGDQAKGINPYLIISCESQSVKSVAKKNSLTPAFEFRAIFYRKKVSEPLTVQLWSDDLGSDKFLGQVMLSGRPDDVSHPQQLQLKNKGSKKEDNMPGKITLRILTSNELTAL